MYVVPVFHKMEIMDISLKKVQIERMQHDGLICKDNIRADIKVAFFVRVNKSVNDVINVAQSIGTERASNISTLKDIFEAKFSEALKTVGKKFDFIELYEARREEEKAIKKQNVEVREAILELERQLAEKEEKQKREIDNIRSREEAEIQKVREEERLKAETVRISTEESLSVQEENKLRQVIIAEKNKQRTEAVEAERVEKDRALERTERERVVTLAEIDKQSVIEIEKKNIQDVIRERVQLEKGVVEEQQSIKDIEAFREIDRKKQVGITAAAQEAEQDLIITVKQAEAAKLAAEEKAKELLIDAEAQKEASAKQAEARKILADAKAREDATYGLAEAEVIKAKAEAMKKLDGVGKEHEEFKLRLPKEKDVELAQINIQKSIADAQALVLSEALKNAKIDIVGGETMFFDNIVKQISNAKGFDRLV